MTQKKRNVQLAEKRENIFSFINQRLNCARGRLRFVQNESKKIYQIISHEFSLWDKSFSSFGQRDPRRVRTV